MNKCNPTPEPNFLARPPSNSEISPRGSENPREEAVKPHSPYSEWLLDLRDPTIWALGPLGSMAERVEGLGPWLRILGLEKTSHG